MGPVVRGLDGWRSASTAMWRAALGPCDCPFTSDAVRGEYESCGKSSKSSISVPLAPSFLLRISLAIGGACRKRRTGATCLSSSTNTTIHTPTAPDAPSKGVQCIQRGLPSSSEVSRLWTACESHRILAVTPREPSARALPTDSRTRELPPMRSRKCDWRIPGTRREGEVKRMRREGAGRTRRY
jgi:hypothetical protein